jgi:VanZ family protein
MSARALAARRWLVWVPVLVVMAVIFALSSQSGLAVSEDPAVEKPIRATGHLLAYGVLAGLSLMALSWGRRPRVRDAAIAFAIAVVYGLTDEFHQSFVPTRNGRLDDVVIDTIGALAGIAVAWLALTMLARAREVPSRRRP